MTDVRLVKIFAWAIGVLSLLWLLTECLGGVDPTDTQDDRQIERDLEQYASDCGRAWEALELMGEADHGNVDSIVDKIDLLATDIEDPNLSNLAFAFSARTQELVSSTPRGEDEQLNESYMTYRNAAEVELGMRCTGGMGR